MNSELTLQLVDNHRQFLAFLERRLGDRALAEDILQDAFVKSLQKEEDARDETSSVAWFYRTLRNAVIDHYRRTGARSRALESFARELEDAVEPPPEVRDEICGCVSRRSAASTSKAHPFRTDDLLVMPGELLQARDDLLAQTAALMIRMHRDVGEVRNIDPVRDRASRADEDSILAYERSIHAVREDNFQIGRFLVAERRNSIEVRQLVPIHRVQRIAPFESHG